MAGSQSERLDALWVALHTVAEASQEDLEFLMVCWTDEDLKCECAHVALRQSSGRYGRRTKAAVDAMTVGSSSSGGADPSTGPPNMQVKPVAKTKPGTDKEVSAQGPVVFYDTGDSYSKGHFFLYSTAGSQQGSQTAESSTAALAAAIAPAWTRVTMSDQWHGKMAMLRLGHWSSELAPQALEIPESIPLKETMTHDQPCDIKSRRISSISCFTIGGTSMVAGGMLPVQSAQPTADWPGPEEFLQLPPMPPVSRAVRTEIHVEVQAPKALSRSCRPKYAPVEKVVEAGCDLPVTLEGCSSAAPPFMVLRWLGRGGWGGNGLSANVVLYSKLISSLTAVDWKVTFGAAVTACGQPGSRHNWTLVLQLWSLLQRDVIWPASHWQAAFGLCRHIREAGLWENEATYVLACGSCGPLWQSALAFVSTEKGTTRSLSSVLKACEMAAEWTQALRWDDFCCMVSLADAVAHAVTQLPESLGLLTLLGVAMEVCITTLSGESYQLQADPTWASRDLKMAVKTASGIRLREQRLVCGTKELPEDLPLASLCPSDEMMSVTLIRRPAEQVQLLEDLQDSHHPKRVLREAPAKFRSDREVVLTAVVRDASCLSLADKTLQQCREFALNLADRNGMALKYCTAFQDDLEVCMAAVKQDGFALQYASAALRKSKAVVLAAVGRDGLALEFAAPELRQDKEVVLAALEQDALSMDFVADCLKIDRDFLLFAVSVNGRVLERLAEDLQRDQEIVLAACQESSSALRFAHTALRHSEAFVLTLLQRRLCRLNYPAEELWARKEFVLEAVKSHSSALQLSVPSLREDREVVMAAVQKHGYSLQFASDELRGDREVVMKAVRQYANALAFASEELRADAELVIAAISKDGCALRFAAPALRANRDFVLLAVRSRACALQFAAKELRLDETVVLHALEADLSVLEIVETSLWSQPSFLTTIMRRHGHHEHVASFLGQPCKKPRRAFE
ncbi:hypothetical protein AK812_SmicGene20717 [Symbiodinium microadriaticum]|uniref:Ubiquitin-like domain-containing protein n=1 Tax=Symbiodinium microadriaticum TaxID=2951 RepID=A0A1Q9DP85_SYMMI|nr:hypothetical protein AK812_SmicGene20717 [Symbiodinium microadriaticum]